VHKVQYRRSLFENKLETIRAHNANPSSTYKMGVNHLTDRSEEVHKKKLKKVKKKRNGKEKGMGGGGEKK
jgi:hypothetical protein